MAENTGMTNLINHRLLIKENKPVAFSEETLKRVHELTRHYPEGQQKSAILAILHIAQEELGGYLTVDIMDYVASILAIQPIEVYEVATFYSMFYLEKVGKYVIEVCHTASCAFCGGDDILAYLEEKLGIKRGETTKDGIFTLKSVECLGACGYAPVMQINTLFHEELTRKKIDKINDNCRRVLNDPPDHSETWEQKFF